VAGSLDRVSMSITLDVDWPLFVERTSRVALILEGGRIASLCAAPFLPSGPLLRFCVSSTLLALFVGDTGGSRDLIDDRLKP